jgi:N-acetylmuramoyl-L-alanine amidase
MMHQIDFLSIRYPCRASPIIASSKSRRVNCLDFRNIRSIDDMVYQSPGGFEAIQKSYFYQKAWDSEIRLAQRAINGERQHPASNALWFFRPAGGCPTYLVQPKQQRPLQIALFFVPEAGECPAVY